MSKSPDFHFRAEYSDRLNDESIIMLDTATVTDGKVVYRYVTTEKPDELQDIFASDFNSEITVDGQQIARFVLMQKEVLTYPQRGDMLAMFARQERQHAN